MYRNKKFGDLLMYSSRKKGNIPAAHVYYALYRELSLILLLLSTDQ